VLLLTVGVGVVGHNLGGLAVYLVLVGFERVIFVNKGRIVLDEKINNGGKVGKFCMKELDLLFMSMRNVKKDILVCL